MRTIDVSEVTALVRKLCIDANYYLPADLRQAFVDGQQSEQSPLGREIFGEMIANCDLARENNVPVCQDTGMAVVFIKLPSEMDRTAMSSIIWNHLRQGKEDQSVLQVRLLPAVWISMPQI